MIIVHVEHFLNREGQNYFPDWVSEVAEALKKFDGFISISLLNALDNTNECHLLLQFENESLLQIWASSKEHDTLIDKLDPYRLKKQTSSVFEEVHVINNL